MSVLLKPHLIALLVSTSLSSAVIAEEASTHTVGFKTALELAKKHDAELKYAHYSYMAEQEADDTSLSQLLPSVSLSSSYRYSLVDDFYTEFKEQGSNPERVQENPSRYDEEQNDYNFQLRLQQSLINVSAWKDYSSSKESVRQANFTYSRAEQELIYRLSQAYLQTLQASQQVYINQDKLEAMQLKLDQTNRMEELGVGDRLSVLRVAASRDVAKSDLLQAKSKLEDAQTLLENITGKNISPPKEWVENGHRVIPNLQLGTQQKWMKQVSSNTQLLAESANVRSQELMAESRSAQHLPTLDFTLSAIDKHSGDIYSQSTNYVASVDLTIPIYSGGLTSSRAREAEASYNAAQARYEKTLADKQQAVKQAFTQLNSYRERLQALDESRKSSQAFLDAAERQADLSLSSQVDVLEARTDLYDVRLQFANTLSDYLIADLNLLLETGQLNEQTLQKFDQLFNQQAN